jgi:modulator of FtsH protease
VNAYSPTEWHDLYVAMAGATAALAGLLFVAISINLAPILESSALPLRAASALATLIVGLIASMFVLVPGQSRTLLGLELLVISGLPALVTVIARARVGRVEQTTLQFTSDVGLGLLALIPFSIAGISLLADSGGGLYWTVPGLVFVFLAAAVNAWVLLVEIMR